MNSKPILPGCSVLPPLIRDNAESPHKPPATKARPTGHKATGERFAVLNAFVDCSMAELTRAEALTWFVLYRETRDGTACISTEHIAKRIGNSKRAVLTAIAKLRKRKLLVQVFRGGINRGPSRYRVVPKRKPPDS